MTLSNLFTCLLSCLADCDIVGKVNGVCFTFSKEGRPSGEAFIELKTAEDFKKALSKDRKYMGHRYIEGNRDTPFQAFKLALRALEWRNRKAFARENKMGRALREGGGILSLPEQSQ